MNHLNFLFIVKSRDFDPAVHHTCMESAFNKTIVYGVSTIEQACEVARREVQNGVQLIDLCGAFGEAGMQAVVDAIDCDVPVGYVVYSQSEMQTHDLLFPPQA